MRFNPRRPRGRRRASIQRVRQRCAVSIHAAHAGGDAASTPMHAWLLDVSIHAAHAGGDAAMPRSRHGSPSFNPRRPRGRRPTAHAERRHGLKFQSTPPTRAATAGTQLVACASDGFNPRRPRGRRRRSWQSLDVRTFQSTPPTRAATARRAGSEHDHGVSIHAARAGGDRVDAREQPCMRFQSTPPARAATRTPLPELSERFNPRRPRGRRQDTARRSELDLKRFNPRRPRGRRRASHAARASTPGSFQSTPPARAATRMPSCHARTGVVVSIHAARAGGDAMRSVTEIARGLSFNPRRPRGRRRTSVHERCALSTCFNPRRPRGRRRDVACSDRSHRPVSIHAARAGGDATSMPKQSDGIEFQSTPPARAATATEQRVGSQQRRFNPRRPRGRRPGCSADGSRRSAFQSTPPARAATVLRSRRLRRVGVSIHAARAGGDEACRSEHSLLDCFNPRRPRGRRHGTIPKSVRASMFQSTPPARAATPESLARRNACIFAACKPVLGAEDSGEFHAVRARENVDGAAALSNRRPFDLRRGRCFFHAVVRNHLLRECRYLASRDRLCCTPRSSRTGDSHRGCDRNLRLRPACRQRRAPRRRPLRPSSADR